ncbi:MAG TPA: SDR family NAD(P)-dependent oxidoreductase [Candidatus Scatovivens faecipullorum]|nr:SDR family NAD(P)-dependent oxidoreductase [Candidatus Scatovivens faecipullorum]
MEKIVLVTGASRGIGRNIAYNLALDGYKVIANYNNSEKEAKDLQEELKNKNIKIDIFKADVSRKQEVENLVNFVIEKYNKIDVLINNAGIAEEKLFTDITEEDFDKMMKVNLYSVFYTTQEVVKNMLKLHNGIIINISSIYGLTGGSCEVHYSMAKAGIDGMTKALAKELGPSNIRINSIAPGAIDTDMNKNLTEEDWKVVEEETPLNKRGKPIDITRCVKWLIEDEFTTGQVISPNGGLVIT